MLTLLFFVVFFYIGHKGFSERILPLPKYPPNPDKIMKNAEPFFFEGSSDVAFLILHGFTGSPYEVKPIGEYFHKKGHTTLGILLPGHGTKVEDLIPTRFYHYVAIADQFLLNLSKYYKKVFIVGFSMGGAIALKLAHLRQDKIQGIALISTPVFFNGLFNGRLILHSPLMVLTGWLKMFYPVLKLNRGKRNPEMFVGYEFKYPLAALHSFKISLKYIRKKLKEIYIPSAMIINEKDKTVPKESMIYLFYHIKSQHKRLMFLNIDDPMDTGHVIIRYPEAQDKILKFLDEFFNELI
jgi:carboxylesterase